AARHGGARRGARSPGGRPGAAGEPGAQRARPLRGALHPGAPGPRRTGSLGRRGMSGPPVVTAVWKEPPSNPVIREQVLLRASAWRSLGFDARVALGIDAGTRDL